MRQLATVLGRKVIDASGWYVYCLHRPGDTTRPIYVGRTEHIMQRIGDHMHRYPQALFSVERCMTELHAHRREAELIEKWQPEYNKDGKIGERRIGLRKTG